MAFSRSISGCSTRRRAVVAVQVAVLLVVLIGFAAMTIDLGAKYNTRGDLQRTADAAALAGASAYVTDDMMRIRQGNGGEGALSLITNLSQTRVTSVALINPTFGTDESLVDANDINSGWIDLTSADSPLQAGVAAGNLNAVEVTVRREDGGTNGPIQYFFASILGHSTGDSSATAVAVFDDRAFGINGDSPAGNILPFTMHRDAFYQDYNNGVDSYSYHEGSGTVDNSPDGIREIRIYPYPLSGNGYTEGDGNFGVLNIGTGNQGVQAESVQIANGVSAEDLIMEVGTSTLNFFDENGGAITYDITGSPGLEASLKADLTPKIGDVIGFFLHTNVALSGANAIYTITEMRYGRIMDVKLNGPPSGRGVLVQPVSYSGGEVRIDPLAPSTGGLLGRIVLAR